MSDDHVDDQLAAYALGALSGGERAGVEQHLASCPACDGRADEARSVAGMLSFSVPPLRAPADLKTSVFQRIRAEDAESADGRRSRSNGAAPPTITTPRVVRPPEWARPGVTPAWSRLLTRTIPWTVAVIGWIVATALFAYSRGEADRVRSDQRADQAQIAGLNQQLGLTQQRLSDALRIQSYLSTPGLRVLPMAYLAGVARHTTVALIMAPGIAHALVVARGLASLPSDRVYVAWARNASGAFNRLGTLVTGGPRSDGVALLVAAAPLDHYRLAGLSIEHTPGGDSPTTPLIFSTRITVHS